MCEDIACYSIKTAEILCELNLEHLKNGVIFYPHGATEGKITTQFSNWDTWQELPDLNRIITTGKPSDTW